MNQEHAVSISFQIHMFKEKCPIKHVLNCKALKDMKRITEPKWALALVPETGRCTSPLEYDFSTSPFSSVNSTSFLPGPNPNLTSNPRNIWQKKKKPKKYPPKKPSRDQQHFFFISILMKETNSLRLNLESIYWQIHSAHPVGLNLESIGSS